MGLGWFETKPKLEDEWSGKGVLRVGVGCLKAVQFLVLAELVVACVGLFASRATWRGSVFKLFFILRTGNTPPAPL